MSESTRTWPTWADLIGLKVAAYRRYKSSDEIDFVLFDDGATYMTFEEQDYVSNHDCSHSARHIGLVRDAEQWKAMFDCVKPYFNLKKGKINTSDI